MLLAFPLAQFFVFGNENTAGSSKVIDPFLIVSARSLIAEGARAATMIITSRTPLTTSQLASIRSFGLVTSSIGRVTTMQVPADNIEKVLSLDFVLEAHSPREFHPTLDASTREIGARFVWENVTDPNGRLVDGSGVLIGIVDTGVDLSHPDLKFANGTSKVLYLWDQTASGKPPQGFTYGVECSWSEINKGVCAEKDTFGHGTHVASIAASSGLATGDYRGIAPGAYLLIVKSGRPICDGGSWTFDDNTIIDGLSYLVKKARELGMRLVVNLSLGGNIGGHDDTSPLEVAVDDLSAKGIVVTVSAGNEADSRGHASGSLGSSSQTRINWELNGAATNASLDLWYPSNATVSARLVTPSGEEVRAPTSDDGIKTSDGLVTIIPGKTSKGTQWAVSLQNSDGLKTSRWIVIIDKANDGIPARWDAYVDSDSCAYPPATFSSGQGYAVNETGSISIPATATGAIAVGAYVSKNAWFNKLQNLVYLSSFNVGEIASFSSRGPTRDGRTKPDISAPGVFIAAARSSAIPSSDSDPDEYHRVLAGTSMAAPQVAGVIALMLQYNPRLTAGEIRSILVDGAYLDEFTGFIEGSKGSDEWGWGKVDARTATKFFRVTSALLSFPNQYLIGLDVDGALQGLLRGGEVLTLRFLSGGTHTFQMSAETFTANETRYLVEEDHVTFSGDGVFTPNVRVQYLLSLESPMGEVQGEGWYDAGSRANFAVNPPVASNELSRLVGVSFVLDHWVDEHGNRISSGPLIMDSPHLLRAVWIAQLTDWRWIPVITALVVVMLFVLLDTRRRFRGDRRSGEGGASLSVE